MERGKGWQYEAKWDGEPLLVVNLAAAIKASTINLAKVLGAAFNALGIASNGFCTRG